MYDGEFQVFVAIFSGGHYYNASKAREWVGWEGVGGWVVGWGREEDKPLHNTLEYVRSCGYLG